MPKSNGLESIETESSVDGFLTGQRFADIFDEYNQQGYVVIEGVLLGEEIARVRADLEPLLEQNITGRNNFEGIKSNRLYALAGKSPAVRALIEHPLALKFAEQELGSSFLLSACLAINLLPGESVQPWHYDTGHLQIPRPREAYGLSAFWAIDDTTEVNGATEVIPGSHAWGLEVPAGVSKQEGSHLDDFVHEDEESQANEAIKVTMTKGSLMLAKGTLWHRGGANFSDKSRLIVTPQYCPGWSRQLENMVISIKPEIVATLSSRLRELIGYSIHPPFMGYADGVHPARHLPQSPSVNSPEN